MATVAITGGTGFLGAAIIDLLRSTGRPVQALARDPRKLADSFESVDIVRGDLDDAFALERLARGAGIFIHCAGLTRARSDTDFHEINAAGAARAAAAAAAAGARFVHISSMAAREPDVSAYAQSKAAGERMVGAASAGNYWIALRAPALYGPRDTATLPFFRAALSGWAPAPAGAARKRLSILYVEDMARAVLAAAEAAQPGIVYEVGDDQPNGHSWPDLATAAALAAGRPVRSIGLPGPLLMAYGALSEAAIRAVGGAPMVTAGKIREMLHPDWVARTNLLTDATGWRATTSLNEGFAKTVRWYQERGLLKPGS